jgi:hypothetical protein
LFHYVQIIGGNKYREGYLYKITNLDDDNGLNISIENALQKTLQQIKEEYSRTVGQNAVSNSQNTVKQSKISKTTQK